MGVTLMYSGHGSDKNSPVTAISRLWNYKNKSRWQIFRCTILKGEIVRKMNIWILLYFNHHEKPQ